MAKELNGQMVTKLTDIKSLYSGDNLMIYINKKLYYIHLDEINKLMNDNVKFKKFKKQKKSPRIYLEITDY